MPASPSLSSSSLTSSATRDGGRRPGPAGFVLVDAAGRSGAGKATLVMLAVATGAVIIAITINIVGSPAG